MIWWIAMGAIAVLPLILCLFSLTEEPAVPKPKSEFPRSTRWKIDQIKKGMEIRAVRRRYEYYSCPTGIRRLTLLEKKIKERNSER